MDRKGMFAGCLPADAVEVRRKPTRSSLKHSPIKDEAEAELRMHIAEQQHEMNQAYQDMEAECNG